MNNLDVMIPQSPIVSVICLSYNHSKYIRQALESILMQRTNFPIEILVHDDASTDDTKLIIKEYFYNFPHIIRMILQETNQYSIYGFSFLEKYIIPKIKGKYIAVCEGDDFWIDPLKLQKQVDFLESNPDYGLVHTKAANFIEEKQIFIGQVGYEAKNFEELITENTIVNLTTCFRYSLFKQYIDIVKPSEHIKWTAPDFARSLWFIQHSKVKFLEDITGVYRVGEETVNHSRNDLKRLIFGEGVYDIVDYYLSKSHNKVDERKIRARYHSNLINTYFLTRKWDGIRRSLKIFYDAKDWLNILWITITLPFFYSSFLIKGSYRIRAVLFNYFNIYPIKKKI